MSSIPERCGIPKKILIIRIRQVGDILMSTPLVKSLRLNFPDAEIHFMALDRLLSLVVNNPHIDRVWRWPNKYKDPVPFIKLLFELRRENFDVCIDLECKANTAVFTWLLGATSRISRYKKNRSFFYTDYIPPASNDDFSAVQQLNAMIPLGVEPTLSTLECVPEQHDFEKAEEVLRQLGTNRKIIAVTPVTRRPEYKQWGEEKFAQVCDYLISQCGYDVLFLWGPGEMKTINKTRSHMKEKDLGDYEMLTLLETVALLTKVELLFGNDNGVRHLGISAGTPTFAVFGKPLASNWTPPNEKRHGFLEHDPGCKRSCHYPRCGTECIRDITATDTIEKLSAFIELNGL